MPHLEIEFKAVHRKIFFGDAKKRYASHCIWKEGQQTNRLEVTGFETKRSDSSQFTKKLMETVFNMLLVKDSPKEEVLSYIGEQIDRIRRGDYKLTEIGIPKGISKDITEYGKIATDDYKAKGIPANIRGARYSMKQLGLDISTKPKMVYIISVPNGYEPVDVLCFDEDSQVPPGTMIDTEKMLEKLVKDKMEPIFDALGWSMTKLSPFWHGKKSSKGEQMVLL